MSTSPGEWKRRKAAGLCAQCGHKNDRKGKAVCSHCNDQQTAKNLRRYHRLMQDANKPKRVVCPSCGHKFKA